MFHLIKLVIVGLVAGLVARLVFPGLHMSLVMTAVLGIAGSLVAGLIGQMLHPRSAESFHPAGFIYSIVGALIIVFVGRHFLHAM